MIKLATSMGEMFATAILVYPEHVGHLFAGAQRCEDGSHFCVICETCHLPLVVDIAQEQAVA